MQGSKQTIPHFYLQASANAEPMMNRRQAASPKPVWEAFFVQAAKRSAGRISIASDGVWMKKD